MEEYISFDEQTKNLYKAEGKKEGVAEFKEKLKQELQGVNTPEEIMDIIFNTEI